MPTTAVGANRASHRPNSVCLGCGCLCDDLEVRIADGRVAEADRACEIGRRWFQVPTRPIQSSAFVDGKPVAPEAAVERAVAILKSAKSPTIFGMEYACTADHRQAVALADRLGGAIDVGSAAQQAFRRSFQEVGQSACTLGEVRGRADLVVFWGCDPATTHPRHLERYSRDPKSRFLPGGARDRTIVVIAEQPNAAASVADLFVAIPKPKRFAASTTIHAMIAGKPFRECHELPTAELADLAARMKRCRYGACFLDENAAESPAGMHFVEAMFRLVRDLNLHTRFVVLALGGPGNPVGAENVLTWQTGFPFAVDFARGFPTFGPTTHTAEAMLSRRRADAALALSNAALARLSASARDGWMALPTILLDEAPDPAAATVTFATAPFATGAEGAVYRTDDVPLPKRAVVPSLLPTPGEVLAALLDRFDSA